MKNKHLLSLSTAILISGCGGGGGNGTNNNQLETESNSNTSPILKNNIQNIILNVKESSTLIIRKEDLDNYFYDKEDLKLSYLISSSSNGLQYENNEGEFVLKIPEVESNTNISIDIIAKDKEGAFSEESLNIKINIEDNPGNIDNNTNIADITLPELKLNGNSDITIIIGNDYNELGATAVDNIDGDISNNIIINGNVDTTKAGIYNIEYSVKDSSNNSTIIIRKVNVIKDNIPPTIDLIDHSQIMLEKGGQYLDKTVEANDNIDGDISYKAINNGDNIDTQSYGKKEITYSVKDSSGNNAEVKEEIVISDYTISIIGVSGVPLDNKFYGNEINPTFDIKINYDVNSANNVKMRISYKFTDTSTCENFNDAINSCDKAEYSQELDINSISLGSWYNINNKGHLYVKFTKKDNKTYNLEYFNEGSKLLQGINQITLQYGRLNYLESSN